MKYCDKCERVYESDIRFCPKCGKELVEPVRYDIFGEKLNEDKKENVREDVVETTEDENKPKMSVRWYESHINEILAWVSLGAFLVPVIGTIVSGLSLFINITIKKKGFIILSIITLLLSIGYLILLYYTGTFTKLIENANV